MSDIFNAIDEICIFLNIPELQDASQRQYKALLKLLGKKLFSDKTILKDTTLFNNNSITNTTANRHDDDILLVLCEIYIFLCDRYKKLVSVDGYAYFIGSEPHNVYEWKNNDKLSTKRVSILKKLSDARNDCLKDKCFDNNNITGTIAVGNVDFNWNSGGYRVEVQHNVSQLQNLPQFNQDLLNNNS